MSTNRLLASATVGVCLLIAVFAAPSTALATSPSSGVPPTLPQPVSATTGARWLASQLNPAGFVPSRGNPAAADLSATANTVLALASAGDDGPAVSGLNYLAGHVDAYVTVDGSDGPGQLALLVLAAHALGADPTSFGGTNLVSRLLATEQATGRNVGLFGAQDATFDGAFRQGLALSALAAAGVTSGSQVAAAAAWLEGQQCPAGGWTSLITVSNPCTGDPANFQGPDTNSTAQALQGLSAEGVLTTKAAHSALTFIATAQDSDGGWGFEPNAPTAPGSTDPDSTALVVQAILALGRSPSSATFVKGSANPVSVLTSFQLVSGPGDGAFFFPGSSSPNLLATYQAVPAVSGVTLPFNLSITTSALPGATVHTLYAATLTARGGSAPYRWKVIAGSGTLPPGLRLDSASGTISGRPKASGTSSFSVEVFAAKSSSRPHTEAIAWRSFSLVTG